ncbi:stage II sporulation serine phosphatase for sigma-F activation [Halalkalibacter hemicellulosilyticusJCM 9152]|uniref:Stage II sporulation serine phosphatase for sigma-F activation n=1 Tax=Halalkalibacter hemicellulosilyticusJCM 9152 TaxID=1236971 RepID=W4QK77_9BACI|nr:stage II sporulation serine phosphatase for sigma-F activation [Halalkalibacter hemicellulosilyticusJCM 9152]
MRKEAVMEQAWIHGGHIFRQIKMWMRSLFFQYGLLIAVVGFLLGRAMILAELAPFALPYLAAIYILKKERVAIAAISLVLGALSSYHGQALFIVIAIFTYVIIYKLTTRFVTDSVKSLPYMVFGASILTRVGMVFLVEGAVSQYVWMMSTVEAGLSFILTMIFMQSVPLITQRRFQQPLRNEEIVCLIILLASIMTGIGGLGLL